MRVGGAGTTTIYVNTAAHARTKAFHALLHTYRRLFTKIFYTTKNFSSDHNIKDTMTKLADAHEAIGMRLTIRLVRGYA